MARGYVFEIAKNADDLFNLDQWTINEDASAYGVDYASEIYTAAERRMEFADRFSGSHVENVCVDGETIPIIKLTNEIKEKFFHSRFERFKEATANMTLEQFSTDYQAHADDDPDVLDLRLLIRNTCGDMVYFDGLVKPLDDFIREADPDTKYYVGNVVLIH